MQTILFIKIWIGFDKRHTKCASTAIYIEKLLTTRLPTTICKMCDKCCCAVQLFYFACVCELWMFISLRFLLLIPLKHYNIILTHSKQINWNACWANKFFSSSSNDTNIDRTHSKLYPCHSIFHSEQLIFAKKKNTIHSISVGVCARMCTDTIVSRTSEYIRVFPFKKWR